MKQFFFIYVLSPPFVLPGTSQLKLFSIETVFLSIELNAKYLNENFTNFFYFHHADFSSCVQINSFEFSVQCSKHFYTRVQNWIFECRCPLNLRGFCWCRVTDGWMRGWAARPVNQPRNRLRVASSHSNFHHLIEESERIFITSDICLYVWVFECVWVCGCVRPCVRVGACVCVHKCEAKWWDREQEEP